MSKKAILISIVIIVLVIVGVSIYYMNFSNKNVPTKSSEENIYLLNKTKEEGVYNSSVYNNGAIINLGTTTLGFVKYIPKERKYIVAEPNKDNSLKSNLILVNRDGSRNLIASVVSNMISKVEIINDYLFYKDSDEGIYTAINLNEEKLDKKILLENAQKILTSSGEYVYYLDTKHNLYSYNFYTKEVKEIMKDCETENIFDNNIIITLKDGSLYYYNMRTNTLTEDKYKISDNIKLKVSSDSSHEAHKSCENHGKVEHNIDFEGEIPPITIIKSFNGSKLVFEVPNPYQSGVKNLYLKVKDQEPILIAEDINNVRVFGNDCFVSTLITAKDKKFTGEVRYINLDKPKESRVISNVYLDVNKMEEANDGTYYMSYSEIVDDTPEMFKYRGGLFKFNPADKEAVNIENNVADFAVEGNDIVYAKVNSLTDWDGKYNVYVNNKKVASDVTFVAVRGSIPIYEGEDGYLYIVKNGQVQKLEIKVHDYSSILNS